jgi:transcriptional regulator with XRE-family HTH domain
MQGAIFPVILMTAIVEVSPNEEFKAAREAAGLTQDQAAQLLGVTGKTVSRWETGAPIKPRDLAGAKSIFAEIVRQREFLDKKVPRGTMSLMERILGEEGPGDARRKRIEQFEREMVRIGADDFDADYVRRAARDFIEQIHSAGGTDVDEELETYLEYSLRPWVLKRIDQRRRRSEQQDAEDQGLDG